MVTTALTVAPRSSPGGESQFVLWSHESDPRHVLEKYIKRVHCTSYVLISAVCVWIEPIYLCHIVLSNYIPEKRKFSGILCFRQQHSRRRVVSAITFEGFKLHSSNLTHALLIQIYRTIIDIVVPSKMAAGGHFVQKNSKKKESCVLIWNGKKCDRK